MIKNIALAFSIAALSGVVIGPVYAKSANNNHDSHKDVKYDVKDDHKKDDHKKDDHKKHGSKKHHKPKHHVKKHGHHHASEC